VKGSKAPAQSDAESILEQTDHSLLELVDHVLNKGVVLNGEVIIGLAGIDLVYLRLSALLCAADRVLTPASRDAIALEKAARAAQRAGKR
jgi:hypothetical protein